jgi:hypothetical protein
MVGVAGWLLWQTLQPRRGEESILFWCLGPIVIAAVIVDMRLLGRLAWLISDRMPGKENEV